SIQFTRVPFDLELRAKSQGHLRQQPLLHHVPHLPHPTLKQSRKSGRNLTCFKHLEEGSLTNGKWSRQGRVVLRELRAPARESEVTSGADQQQQGTNPGEFRRVLTAQEAGTGIRLPRAMN